MDVFFGILIVIVFLLWVLGPMLRRFFAPLMQRWMMGKMEDQMRRMAGMPTRKEEKKARKQAGRRQKSGAEAFRRAAAGSRAQQAHKSGVDYLQDFAEDVEFTEIKEYSADVEIASRPDSGETRVTAEEQVSDAEFIEFKRGQEN